MDIDMAALRALEREKEIPFDVLVRTIEQALLIAYHRTEGAQTHARVELDRESGHVAVWAQEVDEAGAVVREYDDTPEGFGRIAATTARQVILQRLRDAEDEQVLGEFRGREGDIVAGVVQQGSDPRMVLVDLGAVEAVLPAARAGAGGALRARRAAARASWSVSAGRQGAVDHPLAHPPEPGPQALRARGARDRRRHRRDRRDRPRGRPPHQDRGALDGRRASTPRAPASARWGTRVRAVDDRAARREDRHRRLQRGPGRGSWRHALSPARGRRRRRSSTRPPGPRASSSPTTSSRWPSARRGRTPGWPPGSPAGGSTSGRTPSRLRTR